MSWPAVEKWRRQSQDGRIRNGNPNEHTQGRSKPVDDADAALVLAGRCGDSSAIDGLLARHGSRIFRLTQKNQEGAEEVVQDVLHIAVTRIDPFLSDNPSRDNGGSGYLTGKNSTQRGDR